MPRVLCVCWAGAVQAREACGGACVGGRAGCTHVLVLRSFPDGRPLPRSLLGIFERVVAPKCLDPFPETQRHMHAGGHTLLYAHDILCLNRAVRDERPALEPREVQTTPPTPPPPMYPDHTSHPALEPREVP